MRYRFVKVLRGLGSAFSSAVPSASLGLLYVVRLEKSIGKWEDFAGFGGELEDAVVASYNNKVLEAMKGREMIFEVEETLRFGDFDAT